MKHREQLSYPVTISYGVWSPSSHVKSSTCRSVVRFRHFLVLFWHPQRSRGFDLSTRFNRNPGDSFEGPEDLKQLDFGLWYQSTTGKT